MNWKEFVKPTKWKIVIFLVILILANVPFIGTTSPFESYCVCKSIPEGPACNSLDYCYHTFEARGVFWWTGKISAPFGFALLSYARHNNTYESIINDHSIPLLKILRWPKLYLIGLIASLIYFYIISCIAIFIYDRKFRKK